MSVLSLPTHDSGVQDSWAFLKELLTGVCPRDFAVRLWDGTNLPPDDGQPTRFTLVLQHAGALKRMFSSPTELTLGEAYIYNDYDIEGDIEAAVRLRGALVRARTFAERLRLGSLLLKLPETGPTYQRRAPQLAGELHSKQRDCRAVRYHYDLSNEFYALFLDSRMVYSEGYFASPEDDLDTAQLQKLDKICRALRLNAGERLLDIGCGWGGLIIHAARNFGIEAVGITLSEAQAELARERVREAGLEQRCRVEVCDYRDLSETESFDKIASIGMVEHVGAKRLPGYFAQAWRLLRSGGAFALSGSQGPSPSPPSDPVPSAMSTFSPTVSWSRFTRSLRLPKWQDSRSNR